MYRSSVILYLVGLLSITLALAMRSSVHAQNSIGLIPIRHSVSVLDSTKEQDGLVGSVRRVKTESAKVESKDGQTVDGPLQLIELTTYSIKGSRLENVSYPAADSQVGKEEYKYDTRGNIIEMTLRDDQGAIVNKESYSYEFDDVGNWTKMVTSLVLFENGKLKREPIENTYRTITYYFTDDIAKIVDSPQVNLTPTLPSTNSSTARLEQFKLDVNFAIQSGDSSLFDIGAPPALMRKHSPSLSSVPTSESRPSTEFVSSAKNQSAQGEVSTGQDLSRNRLLNLKRAPEPQVGVQSAETSGFVTARIDAPVESTAVGGAAPTEDSTRSAAYDLYGKGLEYLEKGDLQTSIAAFRASLALAPSAEVYMNLGTTYLKAEKNNDATKAFKESVRLNPDAAEAQYGLGLSLFRLKRFVEARGAFSKASTLEPKMAKAYYGLGLCLLELGQPDAATRVIRTLETLDKGLAKKLAQTTPSLSYSCRATMLCR